jgi:hypothetical protein
MITMNNDGILTGECKCNNIIKSGTQSHVSQNIGIGDLASEWVLPGNYPTWLENQWTGASKKNRGITLEMSRALAVLAIRPTSFTSMNRHGQTAEVCYHYIIYLEHTGNFLDFTEFFVFSANFQTS